MKTKFYLLLTVALLLSLSFNTFAQNTLKSINTAEPLALDSNSIVDISADFIIANGNEEGDAPDQWWIGDGDPGKVWLITRDVYDNNSYVTVLHGERKEDDENNTNSFFLWNPTDSGVPWNISSPIVTFKVKISDGQDYTRNQAAGNLGIYFWAQIKDDDGYRRVKVRLTGDAEGIFTGSNEWWNYTPYGLGTDLNDGNWHTYTINLKNIIQEYRDWAYNDSGDPKAGHPFKFYGIIAIETRCLDTSWDDIIVMPETATAISDAAVTESITIFPNPSAGSVTITGISNGATVKVYNITGSKVASYVGIADGGINLSGLSNGTYFVRVDDGNTSTIKKLIIVR